jgi:hypothetical protein
MMPKAAYSQNVSVSVGVLIGVSLSLPFLPAARRDERYHLQTNLPADMEDKRTKAATVSRCRGWVFTRLHQRKEFDQ